MPADPSLPVVAGADLPEGSFSGPQAFAQRIRDAIEASAGAGWREVYWSDPDFVDWPLGERAVADALQRWAGAGRRLVLVAQDYGVFERHHARFVTWRRMWSHIVEARVCKGPGLPEVPSGIWTPDWHLRRLDIERCHGVSGSDALGRRQLRENLDECLRHSRAGFPVTTLGL
ncbi:hypothetical protein QTH91_22900 [Variovorax dokdonensis]|uniref:TIR domain-containing protein n=1 Tax=Variovorax dokdonensis TaxID=344883 RepID=A0ABT7NHE6_9BURK|nr:hypothetical protein [Variovorax dokdonensis]MDM0047358.1 hypothetical protein [Variovorax dokdonensis]